MATAALLEVESEILFKANSGQINVDKAEGVVECFVAAIGNKDSVGDIILPGAFSNSLKRRKPRVVWGHNWNEPIGKVLSIEEVASQDRRLPGKMREAGVGGLLAKVQFNLNSERGREAFSTVAFFGEEQEWAIGYKTINADYDPNAQANMLKEVELYEVSPVLHGANQLTGTLSVKDGETAACGMNGCECGTKTMSVEPREEKGCGGVPQHGLLPRALSVAMKQPIQIRQVNGDMVVFDTPPDKTWVTKFAFDDDRFMFVEPKQVEVTMVVRPLTDDGHEMSVEKAGDCGCGGECEKAGDCGGECGGSGGCKNAPMIEVETKAGRKISNRNLQKIEQALNLLKDVMTAAAQPVVGGELEQKLPKTDSKRLQIGSDKYHDHRGMINVSVKSEVEAAVVVDSLAETDASFTFPSSVGYFEGDSSVSILVPAVEAVANVIREQVVGALSGLDFDVSVAVEK